jgi:hypothetical protein
MGTKWEKGQRAEVVRKSFNDASAPAVQRMVDPVARLGAPRERAPPVASGHASENDRANIRERAAPFALFEAHRSARYEAVLFDGGED